MRFSASAIFSALVALAAAQANNVPTADTSKPPSGNPISKPGLNEQVPKGQTYTITWSPTTSGTVSLVLLRGPSENVQPLSTIVSSIANTGTYAWAVSDSLEVDTTHYGIELIDDAGHTYQYSTQFGISGSGGSGAGASGTGSSNSANSTSTATVIYASSSATGTGNVSIPVLTPTNPMTVPSTLTSTATSEPSTTAAGTTSSPASSQSTGAAAPFAPARNVGAFAIAGLVGALML